MTFEIDLPPRSVSPNKESSTHWRGRGAGRSAYRNHGFALCRIAISKSVDYIARRYNVFRHKEAAETRCLGKLKFTAPILPAIPRLRMSVEYHCGPTETWEKGDNGYYRPRDEMNAIHALKAAVDGFCDAGLMVNDTAEWLHLGELSIVRNAKRNAVIITVEEM